MSKNICYILASIIIGLIIVLIIAPIYKGINKWEVNQCEEKGGKAIVKYSFGIPYDTYCQLGE